VVVADDTAHVRRMLVQMLELDGFSIVGEASDGYEVVRVADEVAPDVVVMDYMMPKLDGLAAARRLRELRPGQHIILYSAFLDAGVEREARAAGIALCLGKVEGLWQLERHIRAVMADIGIS
jgi:response regulator NasT